MFFRVSIDNDPTKAGLRAEQAPAESRLHRVSWAVFG
jgi:hypothetical protein